MYVHLLTITTKLTNQYGIGHGLQISITVELAATSSKMEDLYYHTITMSLNKSTSHLL